MFIWVLMIVVAIGFLAMSVNGLFIRIVNDRPEPLMLRLWNWACEGLALLTVLMGSMFLAYHVATWITALLVILLTW